MRSAPTGFFSTFASTKSLMRHRSSQRLKNVAASLYGPGPCDTVKAVNPGLVEAHSNLLLTEQYLPGVTPASLAKAHSDWNDRHAAPLKATWPTWDNARDPERRLRL